jgi:pimeloyl-ACP methyl ester carboxylesterase
MPQVEVEHATIHYQLLGNPEKPKVMLIAGLGGIGMSWWPQVERFAERYHVVLPDHRGTGQSSRPAEGHTLAQNAQDLAAVLRHAGVGPAHIVGSSAGGAIAQIMALDHADLVRSVTLSSSFARADAYIRREFSVLRYLMGHADMPTVYTAFAMILFAPENAASNPEMMEAWIDRAAQMPEEREIWIKRIDMVMAYDELTRLGAIRLPTCVICGDQDVLAPLSHSIQVAEAIPGSVMHVIEGGGHQIHTEKDGRYFELVSSFIDKHETASLSA